MNLQPSSLWRPAAFALAAALLFTACAPLPEAKLRDSSRLGRVYRGMTRAEFFRVMGTELMYTYRPDGHIRRVVANPYKSETFVKGDVVYEVFTYYVNRRPKEGLVTPDELVPYVFFDGKFIGSGWEFLKEMQRPAPEPLPEPEPEPEAALPVEEEPQAAKEAPVADEPASEDAPVAEESPATDPTPITEEPVLDEPADPTPITEEPATEEPAL